MTTTAYRSLSSLTWRYWAVEAAVFGAALACNGGWAQAQVKGEALDPPPVSAYQEARGLLRERKWADAAVVLRSLLRRDPDQPRIAIELSEALLNSGRRE